MPIVSPPVEVTTTAITTGSINGDGIFDVLIKAVRLHLAEEYDSGRLTGTEYAQVYSAALVATLGQSIQFALSKDAVGYNVEQLAAQTALVVEQTEVLEKTQNFVPLK